MEFKADGQYEQVLLRTLIQIQTHLDGDLSLETLAQQAGFSPYHFHRIFGEFVGEPLLRHVRRLRLERGAYRLKISDEPIVRIALDVGYHSHEAFSRAFKQQFGVTPSSFRSDFLQALRQQRARGGPLPPATEARPFDDGAGPPAVRFERIRPIVVAFIRHTGPYEAVLQPGSRIASLWEALFRWGEPRGLAGPETLLLGIPQDDPTVTAPAQQRFDVAIQLPPLRAPGPADGVANYNPPPGQDNIGIQTLSPGLYAVGRHYGSFDHLVATYTHIYETAVVASKYRLRPAPPFEVYAHTRVRDDLLIHHTDVYLPVEPDPSRQKGGN